MPLYEYECARHGRFEVIRRFSDPPLEACPRCGRPIEKLLAAPAIQFKGSGWYVTDYARKSGVDKADGKGPDVKPADSSASKDAKPGNAAGAGASPSTPSTSKDTASKTD